MRSFRIVMVLLGVFLCQPVIAQVQYNANISMKINNVITYSYGNNILFIGDQNPFPACGPYFVIHESISSERRQQMLARIMLAYAMKEEITIGYDSQNCMGGQVYVFRIG